ncbi:DUF7033 domain-containing protein [Gangjinia marincola]|uniref:DUF7033 domain-containing protein n=1 Tax=Gangjinia marincola TaxID=578463 RepID=UPI0031CF120B
MILVYTPKLTSRITYIFKHICQHLLGIEARLTSIIDEFVAHEGPKISYGQKRLGNEFFVKQHGLLHEQGFSDVTVKVQPWDDTICFFKVSENSDLPFDIFSASFYLLSRYEEYMPHVKDSKGRFPAEESLGYKHNFLDSPVIDIWAQKFLSLLQKRFDVIVDKPISKPETILTVKELYRYQQKGILRTVGGFITDLSTFNLQGILTRIKVLLGGKSDPYDHYDDLIDFSKTNQINFTFMFQLSDFSIDNRNINFQRVKYRSQIKSLADYGSVGLHVGTFAIKRQEVLKKEKLRLEDITNEALKKTIVSENELNLPDYFNHLVFLEVEKDYSMGYPNKIGFRAGTCSPFLFYEINYEQITPLKVVPYVFHDYTLGIETRDQMNMQLVRIKNKLIHVEGKLVMIFSNSTFEDEKKREDVFSLIKFQHEK